MPAPATTVDATAVDASAAVSPAAAPAYAVHGDDLDAATAGAETVVESI